MRETEDEGLLLAQRRREPPFPPFTLAKNLSGNIAKTNPRLDGRKIKGGRKYYIKPVVVENGRW